MKATPTMLLKTNIEKSVILCHATMFMKTKYIQVYSHDVYENKRDGSGEEQESRKSGLPKVTDVCGVPAPGAVVKQPLIRPPTSATFSLGRRLRLMVIPLRRGWTAYCRLPIAYGRRPTAECLLSSAYCFTAGWKRLSATC